MFNNLFPYYISPHLMSSMILWLPLMRIAVAAPKAVRPQVNKVPCRAWKQKSKQETENEVKRPRDATHATD